MKLFPWQKDKPFFTVEETAQLVDTIRIAEQRTSGEIRLFVESKCKYVDAMDRAREVFLSMGMDKTELRNATLIYVAIKDHQAAILGDSGIHEKVGNAYWETEINKMLLHFRQEHLKDGLCEVIKDLGEALHHYFPYDSDTDKNELPDEIVFGS